jgi:hypothetical protein
MTLFTYFSLTIWEVFSFVADLGCTLALLSWSHKCLLFMYFGLSISDGVVLLGRYKVVSNMTSMGLHRAISFIVNSGSFCSICFTSGQAGRIVNLDGFTMLSSRINLAVVKLSLCLELCSILVTESIPIQFIQVVSYDFIEIACKDETFHHCQFESACLDLRFLVQN